MPGIHMLMGAEPFCHFPVSEGIVALFLYVFHYADKVLRLFTVSAFHKTVVTAPVNAGYGTQKAYGSDSSFKDGSDRAASFFFTLLPRSMPSSFDSSS